MRLFVIHLNWAISVVDNGPSFWTKSKPLSISSSSLFSNLSLEVLGVVCETARTPSIHLCLSVNALLEQYRFAVAAANEVLHDVVHARTSRMNEDLDLGVAQEFPSEVGRWGKQSHVA